MSNAYKEHITPQQLDSFRKNISHERMILVDSVEGILRDMCLLFTKGITKEAQTAVANKLIDAGYRFSAIKAGLNRITETSQYFPSYMEIVTSVRLFMPQDSFSTKSDIEYEKEQEKMEHVKAQMIKAVGEEGMTKYFKWWCKNLPPFEVEPLIDSAYLKCALFDWYDAGMGNDFEKVKLIGQAKFLNAYTKTA